MRVLWIAPNGGNYNKHEVKGTGGWIGALQEELIYHVPDLELGIAFESAESSPLKDGNVSYFPVPTRKKGKYKDLLYSLGRSEARKEQQLITYINQLVELYKPDLVHVWGIENVYSAVIPYLKCPFVVHIQGLLSLYIYIYMPPALSLYDINKADSWITPKTWVKEMLHCTQKDAYNYAVYRAKRELRVGKYVKNWIGRTEWDYNASQMLSHGSNYFHCDEMMRGDFNSSQWKFHYDKKTLIIHSSISSEWYKGIDVVLNTAKVLKEQGVSVEWNVYGLSSDDTKVKYFEKKLHISSSEVNVFFHGRVLASVIKDSLAKSDVFVHPSYIENSSNAIAEAMLLGVPTVAQYVGGNPSMLRNDSGVLVAANEPYMLANAIMRMREQNYAEEYSQRALAVARERQNTETIIKNLVDIYKVVSKQNQ